MKEWVRFSYLFFVFMIPKFFSLLEKGHARQRTKYYHFPNHEGEVDDDECEVTIGKCKVAGNNEGGSKVNENEVDTVSYPLFYENHFMDLTKKQLSHSLEHMCQHGFDISILKDLDGLQINQLMHSCSSLFSNMK